MKPTDEGWKNLRIAVRDDSDRSICAMPGKCREARLDGINRAHSLIAHALELNGTRKASCYWQLLVVFTSPEPPAIHASLYSGSKKDMSYFLGRVVSFSA